MIELTGIESSTAKWINLGIGFSGLVIACFTPTINATINRRIVILTSVTASAVFLFLIFMVTLLLVCVNIISIFILIVPPIFLIFIYFIRTWLFG